MVYDELQRRVLSTKSFKLICEKINRGDSFSIAGLHNGLFPIFLTELVKVKNKKVLLVLPEDEIPFWEELSTQIGTNLLVFPSWGVYPYEHKLPATQRIALRIRSLGSIDHSNSKGQLILTTPRALMEPTYSKSTLETYSILFRKNEEYPVDDLKNTLTSLGYENNSVSEFLGNFANRGGVIDFFSYAQEDPIRLEMFADTIESIRTFSAMTQRSLATIEQAKALPVNEYVRDFWFSKDDDPTDLLKKTINPKYKDKFSKKVLDELFARIRIDREFPGFQLFSSLFLPESSSLIEHLSEDTIFITNSIRDLHCAFEEYIDEANKFYYLEERTQMPYLLPDDLLINPTRLIQKLNTMQVIETKDIEADVNLNAKSISYLPSDSVSMKNEIEFYKTKGSKIYIGLRTKTKMDEIQEKYPEIPTFLTRFSQGFDFPENNVTLIVSQPFKRSVLTALPRPFREGNAEFYSLSLDIGNLIIHSDYGLGRFIGLETIEADGKFTECLLLEYADREKLYVPVEDFHKVGKYLGGKDDAKLASLKKATFKKVRERAKERIKEYAGELLQLYALRKSMKGFSFKDNSGMLQEFVEEFPYEETEDQAKSWIEINRDMEAFVPMDRLVTGDVGFGKTEMAMRAAFKTILSKKQVAILAPTTVLASQHYENFKERFKDYPIRIELISRTVTAGEQKDVIKQLYDGKIDIIIGTHRILSQDVKFNNLGLLVIDEEQKFGVEQKEKLKMWQKEVDVLTLTATPIPRTLYISLGGVRDLSVINTPPEGRRSIFSEIVEFKTDIIVDAIKRELERDGQVYFLHNRVASINQMRNFLKELMPDVSFGVAHGQMKPAELQNIMKKFINKEFDVLVTTTIIEAGTDIPNVNTLIVNRADRFGLAQLYQLRGRVGRADKQAYAIFLIPPYKTLTRRIRARLRAIMEYSELGSSFQLALRDLEIRGAGNILGEDQHGYIDEIGLDLYLRFLREAVNEIQRSHLEPIIPVPFEVDFSVGIPKSYIDDFELRLEFYRRAYLSDSTNRLERLKEEMKDRFGKFPEPVELMFIYLNSRIIASSLPIERMGIRGSKIRIIFKRGYSPGWYRLQDFLNPYGVPTKIEFGPPAEISINILNNDSNEVLKFLKILLNDIKNNIVDENQINEDTQINGNS